jgi:hypothetical protein
MAKAEVIEETTKAIPLTLDEFCARLSKSDSRVELIGGFYADAKRRGHTKDVDVGFLRAFESYVTRPVN